MTRLVLVGGGHAHLEVLREAARRPFGAEVVLVSPYARFVYSGMMPAQLRGCHGEGPLAVDLAALCRAAGARFVEAAAEQIDAGPNGSVVHAAGEAVRADLLSLDVGAVPAALDVPGAREHAHAVRPLARWRAMVSRLDALAAAPGPARPVACCVVGGGAGGVELAIAVAARCRTVRRSAAVTLAESGGALLPGLGGRAAARARRALDAWGVRVLLGSAVARVTPGAVELAGGERVASELTVWVAGAAAPPLLRASDLPVDEDGFLRVDATLRAEGGLPVWGAGDCVAIAGAPWVSKAGVYAVREAPVLAHNLRLAVAGGAGPNGYRRYAPQRHAMAILDTADGKALLCRRGLAAHARWALWLKRAIDRRFVARYRHVAASAE